MTDNKTIDPEQARLAIELAEACLKYDPPKWDMDIIRLNGISNEFVAYKKYVSAKRIRDAEQELIEAALDFADNYNGLSATPKRIMAAAEKYQVLVKDKAP